MLTLLSPCVAEGYGLRHLAGFLQDVKKHDDPDLVVLATDECLFADEGFRCLHLSSFRLMYPMKSGK